MIKRLDERSLSPTVWVGMIPRYLVNFRASDLPVRQADVVVIGSGVAGLTAALELSRDYEVLLITKSELEETATAQAQGGVAATAAEEDSPDLHLEDTLAAGAGLGDRAAARTLVEEGPSRVAELFRLGVRFDWEGETISLAREGGHSRARVLHAKDATGEEIQDTLVRAAEIWKSVQLRPNSFALDFLTLGERCHGVLLLDQSKLQLEVCLSRATIVASGGGGQIYGVTTNPEVATGDGMAMAYRAGAVLSDLEFVQFHPTALYREGKPAFLLSEALRGEGAYLVDSDGERFMKGAHPLAELAPRDIVTRRMVELMRKSGSSFLYLDARHLGSAYLDKRFPNILKFLSTLDLSLAEDLIPVAPAAHYMIGGVKTDLWGRTNLRGLFASGEVATTGVHGANRLASNALLEGLVFSKRIANFLRTELESKRSRSKLKLLERLDCDLPRKKGRSETDEKDALAARRRQLQDTMSLHMGPIRQEAGLEHALSELRGMERLLSEGFDHIKGFELQNMLVLARLMTRAALTRQESRGVHFREDYPFSDDSNWKHHQLAQGTSAEVAGLNMPVSSSRGGKVD